MLPKQYFEDPLAKGVAHGTLQHLKNNRFTLLKLPVGYGKTVIAMNVAKELANQAPDQTLQIMVIAPKAKRLDNSFSQAIRSVNDHYGVKLRVLPINGQKIGTFAGLNQMTKKKALWEIFLKQLKAQNTLLILDETHMHVRDATSTASKTFQKIFKEVGKSQSQLKILGLTATPFDTTILDAVGYLVLNGNYQSRTAFYNQEVVGFQDAYYRGLNQKNIEDMIIDRNYKIHKEMFHNIVSVINQLRRIIYTPNAPLTFHLPKNEFTKIDVLLSEPALKRLSRIEEMDKRKAYTDYATKVSDYIKVATTDKKVLQKVFELAYAPNNQQALIFYQYDVTLHALKEYWNEHGKTFLEVNGHSQSFFKLNNDTDPVFVQYLSGASAFESKSSNLSIYLDLPTSVINYQQSLGRNARRGQALDVCQNYIVAPQKLHKEKPTDIKFFAERYNNIVNKTVWNEKFEQCFKTDWGLFQEDIFE